MGRRLWSHEIVEMFKRRGWVISDDRVQQHRKLMGRVPVLHRESPAKIAGRYFAKLNADDRYWR